MKLSSTIAAAAAFLLGSANAGSFDFFDFEGWYEGGYLSVAAGEGPTDDALGLYMLLKCEAGDGFNGNNCNMVLRGPSGFSLCDEPTSGGSGVTFSGDIGEYQFNADTGVAEFSLLSVFCDGVKKTTITTPRAGTFPLPPVPVTLQMMPGASNKHVKSLKFTIASTDPEGSDVVSNFYKIAGGFKSS